jgi:hypothetical protein
VRKNLPISQPVVSFRKKAREEGLLRDGIGSQSVSGNFQMKGQAVAMHVTVGSRRRTQRRCRTAVGGMDSASAVTDHLGREGDQTMTAQEQSIFAGARSVTPPLAMAPQDSPASFSGAYYAYTLGREVQNHHQQLFSQYAYEVSRDHQMSVTYGRK